MAGTILVVVLAAAGIGGAVHVANSQDASDLCDPANAFGAWGKVLATEPYSPERKNVARPVADALVGCDRPLIGMSRTEVEARLGVPDRGYRSNAWGYDLGMAEQESVRPGMLLVFSRDGRVRSATAGE